MIERLLSEALKERFREDDLQDCFIVDIRAGNNEKVEIFVDADSQLTLGKCRVISRYLEKKIEENEWLGEKYTLEVSSPGLERPLKLLRQYQKNIGRNLSVLTTDGLSIEGRLEEVGSDSIVIRQKATDKQRINFEQIKRAKILVSFK